MDKRLLCLFSASALLAACESAPVSTSGSDGGGRTMVADPARPTTVPGTQADLVASVGDRVFFDYDSYELRPEARVTLDKQAAWLRRYPNVSLLLEGHTDERGTREYNLALGERRANTMRDYLTAAGIQSARLKTVSYGKERPIVLGADDASWAQNRRGVSIVQ